MSRCIAFRNDAGMSSYSASRTRSWRNASRAPSSCRTPEAMAAVRSATSATGLEPTTLAESSTVKLVPSTEAVRRSCCAVVGRKLSSSSTVNGRAAGAATSPMSAAPAVPMIDPLARREATSSLT